MFLNLVECIRLCNHWTVPSVNLINVAKSCVYCEAHFMAVLYLEIYGYEEKVTQNNKKQKCLSEKSVQEIASKALQAIGCKDAITGFLSPVNSRLDFLIFENNWSEALLHKDSLGDVDNPLFLENLKANGLLLTTSLLNQTKTDYDVYWQLGNWNVTHGLSDHTLSLEDKFKKNHYLALQAIYKREDSVAFNCLKAAREAVISIIKEVSTECVDNIYKLLSKLELVGQAQDFCGIQFATSKCANDIFTKWEVGNKLPYGNFQCKHVLLQQRIRLIESAGTRASRKIEEFHKEQHVIEKYLFDCLEECKASGHRHLVSRYINKLRMVNEPSLEGQIIMEDAEFCRSSGKHGIAIDILTNYTTSKSMSLDKVHCIRILGELKAEVNDSSFEVIHKNYFLKSINVIQRLKETQFETRNFSQIPEKFEKDAHMKSYDAIARYADQQYNQMVNYMKSEAFEMKNKIHQHKKNTPKLQKSSDSDLNRGIYVNSQNEDIDDREIKQVYEKKSEYLRYAVL